MNDTSLVGKRVRHKRTLLAGILERVCSACTSCGIVYVMFYDAIEALEIRFDQLEVIERIRDNQPLPLPG